MSREQFVDPSTGSTTTVIGAAVGTGPAGFLAEDSDGGLVEHVQHRGVGDEVEGVLAGPVGPGPPRRAAERGDGGPFGLGRRDEQVEELGGGHSRASLTDAGPRRPGPASPGGRSAPSRPAATRRRGEATPARRG